MAMALARSQTVSDMAQKVGGDSAQPMVQTSGMATSERILPFVKREGDS